MRLSVKVPRYFRVLEVIAVCAAIAVMILTGMGMKWIAFSRVFGMYLGMFFPVLVLLELSAFVSERFASERTVLPSTIVTSVAWSVLILVLAAMILNEQSQWQFNFGQNSDLLYQRLPDDFKRLIGGSVMVVCIWLIPVGILSGFIATLKRWRNPQIRQTIVLWQASVLVVIVWGTLLHGVVGNRLVSVAGGYFDPVDLNLLDTRDANAVISFTLVPLFWGILFVVFRYAVKYFGFRRSVSGMGISAAVATAVIFLPRIPVLPLVRGVDFNNYGGWYEYRLPALIPPRIWVASLILLGGTALAAGALWLLRREKSTVSS